MISLVVPTYNKRLHIETLLQGPGTAPASTGEAFELIIVDDDSPDGTADAVRALQATRHWLKLLGDLSTAVVTGRQSSRGDVWMQIYSTYHKRFQSRSSTCGHLEPILSLPAGVSAVGGVSDWSLARRFTAWTATLLATFILPGTHGEVRDLMSGFLLLRRHVLDGRVLNPTGYKILLEVPARGNFTRTEEVPFVFLKNGFKAAARLDHPRC